MSDKLCLPLSFPLRLPTPLFLDPARARDRVSAASLTVLDGKASLTLNAEEKKSSPSEKFRTMPTFQKLL